MSNLSASIYGRGGPSASGKQAADLYLDLLEQALTGALFEDVGYVPGIHPVLAKRYNPQARRLGRDWPSRAQTMIGLTRLHHLRILMSEVLAKDIAGDFIETGVWRGGACIFMRGLLAARGVTDRRVWAADSFEGLPPPNPAEYPADTNDSHHTLRLLAVRLEEVKNNFAKYGLLDEQVVFLKGWFKDTLFTAPIDKLAILRLDGDMYESTVQALDALYFKVSRGGFIIVDDYNLPNCRKAVDDFRDKHGISDGVEDIDGFASFWRKSSGD